MIKDIQTPTILVADDDPDDRQWINEALTETRMVSHVSFVVDGEDLLDFLHHSGKYTAMPSLSYPGLILLDLNMPKMDGREALKAIKTDARLRHIPIIILTTSKARQDIFHTYNLGANSVILKPVTYSALVQIMYNLTHFWFDTAELPL
jgi:CheY-like chemotaxis protein